MFKKPNFPPLLILALVIVLAVVFLQREVVTDNGKDTPTQVPLKTESLPIMLRCYPTFDNQCVPTIENELQRIPDGNQPTITPVVGE